MIPSNVIHRVYHIRYKNATGTCFAIDYNNKQYLVTAKHVIEGIKDGESIEINQNNNWLNIKIHLIGHSDVSDVSVFSISTILGIHSLPPTTDGMIYGQDVYFLGFPYMHNIDTGMNRNFPFPLVKKGIISIWFDDGPTKIIFVDGHNNPGFSGGPLVFNPPEKPRSHFQVAGIVSGFQYQQESIFNANNQAINAFYKYNTGIIICYSIDHAIDLIKNNPTGLNLTAI